MYNVHIIIFYDPCRLQEISFFNKNFTLLNDANDEKM